MPNGPSWSPPARRGATCPRTSRPGRWSTSRATADCLPAVSRPSSTISAPCFVLPSAGTLSCRPLSSTAAPFNPLPRAVGGPVTTDTSDARGRRCTWRSIPWDISWPCTSPPPTSRSGTKLPFFPRRCRRHGQRALWVGLAICDICALGSLFVYHSL